MYDLHPLFDPEIHKLWEGYYRRKFYYQTCDGICVFWKRPLLKFPTG